VIAGLGLGAGAGLGVLLILRALFARQVPLAAALAALEQPRPAVSTVGDARRAPSAAGRAVTLLEAAGVDITRRQIDLRVTDRTIERHAMEKLTVAVVGLATPVFFAALAAGAGVAVPYGLVASAALCFGVGGFFLPDVLLRDAARARRDGMRHALSAYLDLVNVLLAGSAGTETALAAASEAGDGWAFAELRLCLAQARARRQSPWEAFSGLGAELGINELQELAASIRLAGEQGAKIKESLGAKAASLRGQQLARAEAAAHAASERMAVPNVVMFVGFLAFAGYPAMVSIIGGI
jgi:Flp pilus assembly protein TadB